MFFKAPQAKSPAFWKYN